MQRHAVSHSIITGRAAKPFTLVLSGGVQMTHSQRWEWVLWTPPDSTRVQEELGAEEESLLHLLLEEEQTTHADGRRRSWQLTVHRTPLWRRGGRRCAAVCHSEVGGKSVGSA